MWIDLVSVCLSLGLTAIGIVCCAARARRQAGHKEE